MREIGENARALLRKTHSAEFAAFVWIYYYAQGSQGRQRFRQHSLATRFFDWWRGAVGEHHREVFLARGDGGGQTRGAAANDEYICALLRRGHSSAFLATRPACRPFADAI